MSALTLATLLLVAPPAAELLSPPDEEAFNLRVSSEEDQAAWDAVTSKGRTVRVIQVSRKRPAPAPKGDGIQRGIDWTGKRRALLVGVLEDEGRWAVQVNGKEPAAPSAASDIHGVVSPDGEWIAFVSGRSGKGDLYVVPAGKTNQPPRRVMESAWPELRPVWSPDGSRLAVVKVTDRGRTLVVISGVASDAANTQQEIADERQGALSVSWRPDGQELAFYGRDWTSGAALYLASPTGGAVQRATSVRPQPQGPAWVQDGDRYLPVVVRTDDAVVAIDPLGMPIRIDTGTFGHAEVLSGSFRGKRALILTALGLTRDETPDLSRRKVYRVDLPDKLSPEAPPDSGLPPMQ